MSASCPDYYANYKGELFAHHDGTMAFWAVTTKASLIVANLTTITTMDVIITSTLRLLWLPRYV